MIGRLGRRWVGPEAPGGNAQAPSVQSPSVKSPSVPSLRERFPQFEIGPGSYGDLKPFCYRTSKKLYSQRFRSNLSRTI